MASVKNLVNTVFLVDHCFVDEVIAMESFYAGCNPFGRVLLVWDSKTVDPQVESDHRKSYCLLAHNRTIKHARLVWPTSPTALTWQFQALARSLTMQLVLCSTNENFQGTRTLDSMILGGLD